MLDRLSRFPPPTFKLAHALILRKASLDRAGLTLMAILRNARRILKFLADGPSYDSVMKNVKSIIDTCTVYIRSQ